MSTDVKTKRITENRIVTLRNVLKQILFSWKSQYITTRYGQLTWSGPIGIPDIGIVLMFICPRWPLLPFMCIILYVAGLPWWLNCCCGKELKHKGKNKMTSQEVYSLLCCLPCTSCQHVKELRYQQKPKIISTFICFCILSV